MKKVTVFLFTILILSAVFACAPAEEAAPTPTPEPACEHQWTEADCVTASVCSLCGEVQAEALGHDWAEATCEIAEHCTRCDETRGEKLEHSYGKWLLDADSMYRLCTLCEQAEHTDIDYARYLEQYVYGHWNLCSMVENGRYREGQTLPQGEVDPEYIFYEDGRIVSFGFQEEELCTSWSIDHVEYDSNYMQHKIYITSPEAPGLGELSFTCYGGTVMLTVPLNNKGDTATLSNSFGDTIAKLAAGTWDAWGTDGLHSITLAEDRSFTANFDGEISGFWQPRQPIDSYGGGNATVYVMLNYEKDGKQCSEYTTINGFNLNRPAQTNRESCSLSLYINESYLQFGIDAAAVLTEASAIADTVHVGTWTSIDYITSKLNYETYSTDEEEGLSTEYNITFLPDGTFTANLHKELKGQWELREIRRDYSGIAYVYRLHASGIEDYSYFQMYHGTEFSHDAYLYISNKDRSSVNYTLRQMDEAEIAAQNEFAAAAPFAVVGEWFSSNGLNQTAVFNEDGTFTLRSENAETKQPVENHGYWHFNSVSQFNDVYTYVYDMETVMEMEAAEESATEGDAAASIDSGALGSLGSLESLESLGSASDPAVSNDTTASDDTAAAEGEEEEQTYWEDYAIILTVKDGLYTLELDSFYAWDWGELTNAEGLAFQKEALATVVGHWSASSATEFDYETNKGTEIAMDSYLDIAEDGSFTGYAGQDFSGYLNYYETEDGNPRYMAYFSDGEQSLFVLYDDGLSAYVPPYSIPFER